METTIETIGANMALNRTINAATIANVPSVFVFICFFPFVILEEIFTDLFEMVKQNGYITHLAIRCFSKLGRAG